MLRVLVLNPYLPTLGGGEKHMGYLCKCIEEYYEDVKIDILVHNYNNIDIHSLEYPTIEVLNERFSLRLSKTSIVKYDLPKAFNRKENYRNKRRIENITQQYDLFVNFMFFSKHEGRAKRNIYSCMFPPSKYHYPNNVLAKWVGKWLDWRFIQSYDYFITNSYFTNHWHNFYWKTNDRTRVIYPPVFSEDNMISTTSVRSEKKNIILSVGRFFVGAHNKKQDVLVDIFTRNQWRWPNWEFHLVGAASSLGLDCEYIERIQQKAQGSRVYLHINSPFSELEELYRKSKIFWHATGFGENENEFPEKMEHFGITTVEAMSYGVVPVVINKGGQTEIIEQSKSGYLWNTEEDLINYTNQLVENEELLQDFERKSYDSAELFSVEKFYKKSKEILDALNL